MKMKRKILAIWMVLIFLAIPFSFAQASETSKERSNESVSIEMVALNEDGAFITEIFTMTEVELAEFESIISALMDRFQSASSLEEVLNIFNNLPEQRGIITKIISKLLSSLKNLRNRGFVISLGHGFKLNPFKKNSFKIRQKSTFWYYSGSEQITDRTIYLKPFALKFKILKGVQFGRMSNFFGIYIFISKKFPKKCTTFFMGTARNINGIEFFSFK